MLRESIGKGGERLRSESWVLGAWQILLDPLLGGVGVGSNGTLRRASEHGAINQQQVPRNK